MILVMTCLCQVFSIHDFKRPVRPGLTHKRCEVLTIISAAGDAGDAGDV